MTDDDLHEFDLDAWAPPAPASGLADAVIARVRRDAPSADAAIATAVMPPSVPGSRRAVWPWVIGASMISAVSAVAVTMLVMTTTDRGGAQHEAIAPAGSVAPPPSVSPPAVATKDGRHFELGGVTCDRDANAEVHWRHDGNVVHVDQPDGGASWTVDADHELVIDLGSQVFVEATGASLRVEAPMTYSDVRSLVAPAIVTTAGALIAITVYTGHARVTGAGQTIDAPTGAVVEVKPGEAPHLRTAAAADNAGLTADAIDRVIRARAGAVRGCYQQGLAHTPTLAGKLVMLIDIDGTGVVASATSAGESTLHDRDVEQCIGAVATKLQFPATGSRTSVRYPFLFSSGDRAAKTPSTARIIEDGAIGGAPRSELPEALGRAAIQEGVDRVKSQIAECGDKSSTHGKTTLKVDVAASGHVARVGIEQTPDPTLGSCLQNVMQRATFAPTQHGGSLTYPFVF